MHVRDKLAGCEAALSNNIMTTSKRPVLLERSVLALSGIVLILLLGISWHVFPRRSLAGMGVAFFLVLASAAELLIVPTLAVLYTRLGINFNRWEKLVVLAGCAGTIPFLFIAWQLVFAE